MEKLPPFHDLEEWDIWWRKTRNMPGHEAWGDILVKPWVTTPESDSLLQQLYMLLTTALNKTTGVPRANKTSSKNKTTPETMPVNISASGIVAAGKMSDPPMLTPPDKPQFLQQPPQRWPAQRQTLMPWIPLTLTLDVVSWPKLALRILSPTLLFTLLHGLLT
jgi:hypothetical protein